MIREVFVRAPASPEKVTGPINLHQLKDLVAKGRLSPDHEISADGQKWVKASQVQPPLFTSPTASNGESATKVASTVAQTPAGFALNRSIWIGIGAGVASLLTVVLFLVLGRGSTPEQDATSTAVSSTSTTTTKTMPEESVADAVSLTPARGGTATDDTSELPPPAEVHSSIKTPAGLTRDERWVLDQIGGTGGRCIGLRRRPQVWTAQAVTEKVSLNQGVPEEQRVYDEYWFGQFEKIVEHVREGTRLMVFPGYPLPLTQVAGPLDGKGRERVADAGEAGELRLFVEALIQRGQDIPENSQLTWHDFDCFSLGCFSEETIGLPPMENVHVLQIDLAATRARFGLQTLAASSPEDKRPSPTPSEPDLVTDARPAVGVPLELSIESAGDGDLLDAFLGVGTLPPKQYDKLGRRQKVWERDRTEAECQAILREWTGALKQIPAKQPSATQAYLFVMLLDDLWQDERFHEDRMREIITRLQALDHEELKQWQVGLTRCNEEREIALVTTAGYLIQVPVLFDRGAFNHRASQTLLARLNALDRSTINETAKKLRATRAEASLHIIQMP